jgi:glycosyltransferase involved in cell wall biosynthesis
MELAYVGSVVPDLPEYRNSAFSPAGNMFQENLLGGFLSAGTPPSLVVSGQPMPAFPRSHRLLARSREVRLSSGLPVHLAAFVNISPIKQLAIGMSVFWRLLRWGWQRRRAQARIVYCYNLTVPPGLFTLLAARCIGARIVASVNDINEPGGNVPRAWPWRLDYWLHKVLLPRFDALVVVSSAIIKDFAPRVRYLRVEGGVTPEMAAEPTGIDEVVRPQGFTIVFAGRMKVCNGVEIVLQAIRQMNGQHYHFLFAGDGPLSDAVRCAASQDPRIEYRGFLKISDLLSIYRQADVLISMRVTKALSTKYVFPSKLVELLASGTAVVSTCPDHVEEEFGGFMFPVREETPEGLVAAICEAETVGRRARRELGQRARKYMMAHKTWTCQAEKVNALLKSIAGESGDGRNNCL